MKTGFLSIGLNTYWEQFPGLLDNLNRYHDRILEKLKSRGAEVVDAWIVDSVEAARSAGDLFAREQISILFLHIATYALSSTVLPIAQRAKVPVIILNPT